MLTIFFVGNNVLGGYEMDVAIANHLMQQQLAENFNIMEPGNAHLYLMFMRNVKKAKEVLSNLPKVTLQHNIYHSGMLCTHSHLNAQQYTAQSCTPKSHHNTANHKPKPH